MDMARLAAGATASAREVRFRAELWVVPRYKRTSELESERTRAEDGALVNNA